MSRTYRRPTNPEESREHFERASFAADPALLVYFESIGGHIVYTFADATPSAPVRKLAELEHADARQLVHCRRTK